MKFIQSVFVKHTAEVIRKQYVLPGATDAVAADRTEDSCWIPHPTPRSIVVVPCSRLVDTPA